MDIRKPTVSALLVLDAEGAGKCVRGRAEPMHPDAAGKQEPRLTWFFPPMMSCPLKRFDGCLQFLFGGAYFDQIERKPVEKRLMRRLERLGYTVTLKAPPQPTTGILRIAIFRSVS